nr:MAG TPA: hypothetical protein [Caudoviricetes sp.]
MSKYIDVDAFVESFRMTQLLLKVWAGPDLTPEQEVVIQSGEAIIKDLIKFPAADVAPVVRCKYCKYKANDTECDTGVIWCNNLETHMPDMGFCSYGERL